MTAMSYTTCFVSRVYVSVAQQQFTGRSQLTKQHIQTRDYDFSPLT